MLEGRRLSKRYGDRTLFDSVGLTLERNRIRVLFGASGEGKSTLIRILAGLEDADEGEVLLNGTGRSDITPRDWRRQVVYVPQNPHMFPGTIEDNIRLGAEYHDLDVDPAEVLRQVEIGLDPSDEARTLSGGEKKRVALGRALALEPEYLLLDEPTGSLDEPVREAIDDLILSSIRNRDHGILVVTHNPREVEKLGVDGYLLSGGTLRALTPEHMNNLEEAL